MSDEIFTKYSKTFLNRKEEIRDFFSRYFEEFSENHKITQLDRLDATNRIRLAGFHPEISGWRSQGIITVSSCEIVRSAETRYDYKFIFKWEAPERSVVKSEPKEKKARVEKKELKEVEKIEITKDKPWKDFTDEEKEIYKQQKEQEKVEAVESFDDYLEIQTLQDVIESIYESKSHKIQELTDQALDIDERLKTIEKEDPEKAEKIRELQKRQGYSHRNYLMVLSQVKKRQESNFVGIINSYWNWKRLGAQVLRNPDKSKPYAYKILIPIFGKKSAGSSSDSLKGFKLGSVFDISQTNKYDEYLKQYEELEQKIETRDEIEYDESISFVKSKYPKLKIVENGETGGKNSSYDPETATLNIREMTSHSVFSALGEHIITDVLGIAADEEGSTKNEMFREITCYILMKKFEEGQEYKINYNFAYDNCWALQILDVFKFGEFDKAYKNIVEHVKGL